MTAAVRRSLIGLMLVVIVAVAGLELPRSWHAGSVWYWKRQCLNFTPQPTDVVYKRLPKGSPMPITVAPYSGTVTKGRLNTYTPLYTPLRTLTVERALSAGSSTLLSQELLSSPRAA